ncbi:MULTISPECIES: hypothetical protein [Rhodococcus]|uniref:hypothetical protein n=1 Tax=Rhodococcus TaxID=1827 RepID=UPI0029540BEE|nr:MULTISPECIES: hypothetical protein [Rhodococcus]MDV7246288.1 hypothetical protein [Rhodococcus oxybenzonivorans]MDV7337240.1 hypothetical protein [Rhodococcus oxybenzonivorans]MDV8030820.1 hypothetical protein [Rhodococcus sp. IEGM 27]
MDGFFVPLDPPDDDPSAADGTRILTFSGDSSELRIFPIYTFPDNEKYLEPKYPQIHTLTMSVPDMDVGVLDSGSFFSIGCRAVSSRTTNLVWGWSRTAIASCD